MSITQTIFRTTTVRELVQKVRKSGDVGSGVTIGLVSPRAATDGVTLFFASNKTDDFFFSHRLSGVMTLVPQVTPSSE